MAKYKEGILGPFKGTVGTVVGSTWMGVDYMRGKSGPNKSSTTPQKAMRTRFGMLSSFMANMRKLLDTCFTDFSGKMSGSNRAQGYNQKCAVRGEYPNQVIDYSRVLVTRGSLPNADAISAIADHPGEIRFGWQNNTGLGIAKDTDRAVLVAYCRDLNQTVYTREGSLRNAETGILSVPGFSGKQVHTWVAFISGNGKEVANSIYAGELMIP